MSIEGARIAREEALARADLQRIQADLARRTASVGREALRILDRYLEALRRGEPEASALGTEFLRLWTVYVMLRSGDDIRSLGSALKEVKAVLEAGKATSVPKSVSISL